MNNSAIANLEAGFTNASDFQEVTVVAGRYAIIDSKRLNIDFLKTYVQSATEDLNDSALRAVLGVDQEIGIRINTRWQ